MKDMLEFGNIYPNLLNLVQVGLMAVIFISVMKWLTAIWQVPGVSDVFASI